MRILVAEDSLIYRRLIEDQLSRLGYQPMLVENGNEAWQILTGENAPRIAILDWIMPGLTGIDICRELRKSETGFHTYVILLTSRDETEDIVRGLEAGADDYITKPFHPDELAVRLLAGLRIVRLQEQLVSALEDQKLKASRDPLTGLWNRTTILDLLAKELERSRRMSFPVGVIMADVDHFKKLNDSYGHVDGDAVLREISRRMFTSLRSYDSVGRYGGEEFLVMLPRCDRETAEQSAERLRKVIAEKAFRTSGGPIKVTVSLGVTSVDPDMDAHIEHIVRTADAALYEAKTAGRNRTTWKALTDNNQPSWNAENGYHAEEG